MKGILFDLDDTLYDYEIINNLAMQQLCSYTCQLLAITPEQFYEAFKYGRNETKNGLFEGASQHNRLIYCQKTLEYLGVNPIKYALEMYETYWGTILEEMKLYEGVLPLMKKLKKESVLIGICTDLTAHIQHRKIRKLGLQEYIDVIVTSEETGKEKPDSGMFDLALKKMSLAPYEVCYVGDSFEKDIIGATNMKIKSYWFNKKSEKACENNISYIEVKDFIKLRQEIFNESREN